MRNQSNKIFWQKLENNNSNLFIEFWAPIEKMLKHYCVSEKNISKIMKIFKEHHVKIWKDLYNFLNTKSDIYEQKFKENWNNNIETKNKSKLAELIDHTFFNIILDEIKKKLAKTIENIEIQNTYNYIDYTKWIDYRIIITTKNNKKIIFWLDLKNNNNHYIEKNRLWYMWKFISIIYDKIWKKREDEEIKNSINWIKWKKTLWKFSRYECNIQWNIQEFINSIILTNYFSKKIIREKIKDNWVIESKYIEIKNILSNIIRKELWLENDLLSLDVKNKVDDIIIEDHLKQHEKPKSETQKNYDDELSKEQKLKKPTKNILNRNSKEKTKNFILLDELTKIINWDISIKQFFINIELLSKQKQNTIKKQLFLIFDSQNENTITIMKWRTKSTKFLNKKQVEILNKLKNEYYKKYENKTSPV